MAVVAAPKMAMRERTETWPMKVAMASNTNTPYTYRCCMEINKKTIRNFYFGDLITEGIK